MSQVGRTLLFTGAVREPHQMLTAIDALMSSVDCNFERVVLSTWFGEIEKYPDLIDNLLEKGVEQVVTSEPIEFRARPDRYTSRGHIFHQLLALKQGLLKTRSGTQVLKSRPDLKLHSLDVLESFVSKGQCRPIDNSIGHLSTLKYQIRVQSPLSAYPFYILDTHFMADRDDLYRMCDFSSCYDICYNVHNAIPEIRFFHTPFRGRFEIIEHALRVPFLLLKFDADGRHDNMMRVLLKDRFYIKALFAYWCILEGFFHVVDADSSAKNTLSYMVSMLKHDFHSFIDPKLLNEVLDLRQQRLDDTLKMVSEPSFFQEDEFLECEKKLDEIAMTVQPKYVVRDRRTTATGDRFVVSSLHNPLLSVSDAIAHSLELASAREQLLATISSACRVSCNFGRADEFGMANFHGVISIDPGVVLWRDLIEAHIHVVTMHEDGQTTTEVIPIYNNIVIDYFFRGHLLFCDLENDIVVSINISVLGSFLGETWYFRLSRTGASRRLIGPY